MSDLRVALIAEGPTDAIVIEAALKALLPRPFVMTQLQPEPTRPQLGTGWGGVLRWCLEFASRGHAPLEEDPTLPGFDLFVIHTDADVAESTYGDVSLEMVTLASERHWPPLPCAIPCPPPDGSVNEIRSRVLAWASLPAPGPKTVLCVPSKAIDAWLASAVLSAGHKLLDGIECNLNLEARLGALPNAERVRKTRRGYLVLQNQITTAWPIVRQQCSQAERFSSEIVAVALKEG
jgi:hypothetical protein